MLTTFANQTRCSCFLNWVKESDFIFETYGLGGFIEKQEELLRNRHSALCYLLPLQWKLVLPHSGSKVCELKATLEVCHFILHHFETIFFSWEILFLI